VPKNIINPVRVRSDLITSDVLIFRRHNIHSQTGRSGKEESRPTVENGSVFKAVKNAAAEIVFASEALGAWSFELGLELSSPRELPAFLQRVDSFLSPQVIEYTLLSEIEDIKWRFGEFLNTPT
jgi:hypothetical protein